MPRVLTPISISLQDLDDFKPDLATYNKQREATLQSDALVAAATGGELGPVLHDNGLYRDANSFVYADHKPTDDQVDRMISKLNSEYVHSKTGCGTLSRSRRVETRTELIIPLVVAASTSGRSGPASATTRTRATLPGSTRRTGSSTASSRGTTTTSPARRGRTSSAVRCFAVFQRAFVPR